MNTLIGCLMLDFILTTPSSVALPPFERPEIKVEYQATHEEEGRYAKYNDMDVEAIFGENDEEMFFEQIKNAPTLEEIHIILGLQEVEGNGN